MPANPTTSAAPSKLPLSSWSHARLRLHADYQAVYKATRKQQSQSMSWFATTRTLSGATAATNARVGITAGRILGKAHERNRIKRRLREIIRRHVHTLPADLDVILHPRRSVLTAEFTKLEAEVMRIFTQAAAQTAAQQTAKQHPA